MQENNQIKALLHLIDDPDEEIYNTVSDKIVSLGKEIIPNLEDFWESVNNESTQERIESLIHRLHYRDLTQEFSEWILQSADLLSGSIIVSKYHYPEIQPNIIFQEIEKLRRNIWLELNNYLTPMERINIINSIFYNYYKQAGVEISYNNPDAFLINKSLENKSGNAISNGIIYLILCHLLDIPVKAIGIPKQFLLAYFQESTPTLDFNRPIAQNIIFYIDPVNGQMYSQHDIENYFKRIALPMSNSYFKPFSNQKVIKVLLEELSLCFDNDNNRYKMNEINQLVQMITK